MAISETDNDLKIRSSKAEAKPSRAEAEDAVRTLIKWAGDNPLRSGLAQTPRRVLEYYLSFFSGYNVDIETLLGKAFYEIDKTYNEMIVLSDINFESCCEHHMLPIIGKVRIAYIPSSRIVGISKIARLVDVYARRLQIQERLTTQIADALYRTLKPKGVGVFVEAMHHCMSYRGVCKKDTVMRTSSMFGVFQDDAEIRREFLNLNR